MANAHYVSYTVLVKMQIQDYEMQLFVLCSMS